jgi:hypothetical protein
LGYVFGPPDAWHRTGRGVPVATAAEGCDGHPDHQGPQRVEESNIMLPITGPTGNVGAQLVDDAPQEFLHDKRASRI